MFFVLLLTQCLDISKLMQNNFVVLFLGQRCEVTSECSVIIHFIMFSCKYHRYFIFAVKYFCAPSLLNWIHVIFFLLYLIANKDQNYSNDVYCFEEAVEHCFIRKQPKKPPQNLFAAT